MGGDGGGSIRIPAACCGLFGLKPQRGRVTTAPHEHLWWALGTVGPLTRSVLDSAIVYDVIRGNLDTDLYRAGETGSFVEAATTEPGRLRIGWSTKPVARGVRPDPIHVRAVEDTARLLGDLGHDVREIDPRYPDPTAAFVPQFFAGIRAEADEVEHYDRLERRTRETYRLGSWVTPRVLRRGAPGDRAGLGQGQPGLRRRRRAADPGDRAPAAAGRHPRRPRHRGARRWSRCRRSRTPRSGTSPATPRPSVPCGPAEDGLPVGVQLVGRTDGETTLLSLSAQLEQARPWPKVAQTSLKVVSVLLDSCDSLSVVTAIEVVDLVKTYGDLRAVDGVSFEVAEGEFFGILGPNGAGKTTLLEMIEGLRRPDAGTVAVLGEAAWPRNPGLLPRIGVQLQASSFFERLTAREQIRTFAALYGVPAATRRRVAGAGRAGRQGRHPGRGPVRRAGAAALDRVRAGARPRGGVPRRADRRARPAGPAQPVGPAVRAQRLRPHRGADHALHGRGRGAVRPGRDHGPRPDPRARHPGRAGARPRRARPDHRRARHARASTTPASSPASTRRASPSTASSSPPGPPPRWSPGWPSTTSSTACACTTGTLEDVFLALTGREYRA